jgi:ornithine cyclodeaminase/alanine dehydrogenase-like protein (mu-crystallin family)
MTKIVEYIDKFIFQKINPKRRLTMLLLTRSDIQKSISIKEAIQVVKYAFAAYSSGKVTIPVRTQIKIPQEDGIILYMPGYIEDSGALGLKIVSVFPINAVGSFTPQTQEIDIQTLLKADKIYVDSIEATLKEAGDFIIPIQKGQFDKANITGEIGEIISHQKIGRENKEEITIFKTVGLSIQDMATGFFIYQKAKKLGLGEEFSLD